MFCSRHVLDTDCLSQSNYLLRFGLQDTRGLITNILVVWVNLGNFIPIQRIKSSHKQESSASTTSVHGLTVLRQRYLEGVIFRPLGTTTFDEVWGITNRQRYTWANVLECNSKKYPKCSVSNSASIERAVETNRWTNKLRRLCICLTTKLETILLSRLVTQLRGTISMTNTEKTFEGTIQTDSLLPKGTYTHYSDNISAIAALLPPK